MARPQIRTLLPPTERARLAGTDVLTRPVDIPSSSFGTLVPNEAGWRAKGSGPCRGRQLNGPNHTVEPYRMQHRVSNSTPPRGNNHCCSTGRTPRKTRQRRKPDTVQATRASPCPAHKDRPEQRQ